MKEMVGGCCVCSDERGWPENPLVYCDGQNCTVAVHQACYGIVTVPTGPWYCRKCESQERPTRVRCELCPSRDGALKKTDSQGWAHVVCALYIPEVRFGNVTTMEPIILQLIPPERYAKTCYICHEIGKPNRATVGACMQCNKSGCKQQFHVTCAQGLGLLCEEAGNYLDNVKYCGYCQHHYSKLKKGGNVKPIPPYKPITHDSSGSDSGSSPEKEIEPSLPPPAAPTLTASASSTSATSIKITTNSSTNASQSTSSTSGSSSASSSSSSKQRKSSSTSKQSNSSSSSSSTTAAAQSATNPGSQPTASNPSSSTSSSGAGGSSSNAASSSTSSSSSKAVSSSSSNSSKDKEKHSKSVNKSSSSSKDKDKDSSTSSSSSSSSREKSSKSSKSKDASNDHSNSASSSANPSTTPPNATGASTTSSSKDRDPKFNSNFNETSVINSTDLAYASNANSDNVSSSKSSSSSSNSGSNPKKRKAGDSVKTNAVPPNMDVVDINNSFRDIIKDVTVTLIPLPMEKPDSESEKSSSKRVKTELSTSPNQSVEPNIQNVSPNLMPGGKQQNQTATANGTNGHKSSSTPKDQDDRLRSVSPYTTVATGATTSTSPAAASSGSATPSLYVSVPLSNANVPGINLPTTTTVAADQPLPTHLSRSNSFSQSERQSPRILSQNQMATSTMIMDHNSASMPSTSSVIRSSPSPSSLAVGVNLTSTTTESGTLKIAYEKQVPRVAQLQEQESAPTRRSRSQSGENSTTKSSSRSGKKRSSANVVLNPSTTTNATPPTSATAGPGSNAATMPVGSSTALERPPSSSSASSAASVKFHAAATANPNPNHSNPIESPKNSSPKSNSSTSTPLHLASSSSSASTLAANATSKSSHSESASSNSSVKPLNKKLLRAQQTHYQHQLSQPKVVTVEQPPQQTPPIHIHSDESTNNPNTSRTPDSGIFPSSNMSATSSQSSYNNGGLKFTYEAQIPGPSVCSPPSIDTNLPPVVKDSPPSSPSSETGSARKRGRKSSDTSDVKLFQNGGIHATHMLGNQLNTASCVSQKLTDQLRMEIQDHSIFTQAHDNTPPMMGVPFPGRHMNRIPTTQSVSSGAASLTSMLGGGGPSSNGPQSLEQLLERQWEQGSQFLMEQAQHFDIASLLSCLHQLRTENVRLEEHVTSLIQRRDHLLAVNARLAIPLTANLPQNQANLNNIHLNGPPVVDAGSSVHPANTQPTTTSTSAPQPPPSRIPRANAQQQSHYNQQTPQPQPQVTIAPIENGVDFRHSSHQPAPHPANALRHSSAHSNYSSSSTSSSSTHHSNHHSVLSSTSVSAASSSAGRQQQQHHQPQPLPSHHHHHHHQSASHHHQHHQQAAQQQQQQQQHHHHHHHASSDAALSRAEQHLAMRGSRGGSSAGLMGGPNGRGGAHIDGPSSSYHNAYSNVHQSQLRREDGPGKPS